MSAPAPAARNPRAAKVHIARKELGLDEPTYRALLARVIGRDSSAGCTDAQLDAVLAEFRRLGWVPKVKSPPLSKKPHVRAIFAIWRDLRPHLRNHGREALRAFVQRQTGVADPEWLDGKQAASVIEALKAWLKRAQAAPKGELSDA